MFAPTATIPAALIEEVGVAPVARGIPGGIVAVGANIGPGGGVEVIVRGGYRLRRGAGPRRRQSIAVRIVGIFCPRLNPWDRIPMGKVGGEHVLYPLFVGMFLAKDLL